MPKLCDGDNGKKNTSATDIGHIALYETRLEAYASHITQKQKSAGATAPLPQPLPPALACLNCDNAPDPKDKKDISIVKALLNWKCQKLDLRVLKMHNFFFNISSNISGGLLCLNLYWEFSTTFIGCRLGYGFQNSYFLTSNRSATL